MSSYIVSLHSTAERDMPLRWLFSFLSELPVMNAKFLMPVCLYLASRSFGELSSATSDAVVAFFAGFVLY